MIKGDPIIAVKDVETSSIWYRTIFGCRSIHGGKEFDVLVSENDEVLICLHKWGEREHPTMINSNITPGNGLILYFRSDKLRDIRRNIIAIGANVEEDIHLNKNSGRMEFSLRDPDGYYLTISDFHTYEG